MYNLRQREGYVTVAFGCAEFGAAARNDHVLFSVGLIGAWRGKTRRWEFGFKQQLSRFFC